MPSPSGPIGLSSLERLRYAQSIGSAIVCLDVPGDGPAIERFAACLISFDPRGNPSIKIFGSPNSNLRPDPRPELGRLEVALRALPSIAVVVWGLAAREREAEIAIARRLAHAAEPILMTEVLASLSTNRPGTKLVIGALAPGDLVARHLLRIRADKARTGEVQALGAMVLEALSILGTARSITGAVTTNLRPSAQAPISSSASVPLVNSGDRTRWAADRDTARLEMIEWLAIAPSIAIDRPRYLARARADLALAASSGSLETLLTEHPTTLPTLRSLTRRDIGIDQLAAFLGIGPGAFVNFESGGKNRRRDLPAAIAKIIERELDPGLIDWLGKRQPRPEELDRAAWTAADRTIRREDATATRRAHEKRQLSKLRIYLASRNYTELAAGEIVRTLDDPTLRPGTFKIQPYIECQLENGQLQNLPPDALIRPHGAISGSLPLILEAKSMADQANANKRQNEEAQKLVKLQARYCGPSDRLFFFLLLGGTIKDRYLDVEAAHGLDWVWEHRIEDLDLILPVVARTVVKGP